MLNFLVACMNLQDPDLGIFDDDMFPEETLTRREVEQDVVPTSAHLD